MVGGFLLLRIGFIGLVWPWGPAVDPGLDESDLCRAESFAFGRHSLVFERRVDALGQRTCGAIARQEGRAGVASLHGSRPRGQREPAFVFVRAVTGVAVGLKKRPYVPDEIHLARRLAVQAKTAESRHHDRGHAQPSGGFHEGKLSSPCHRSQFRFAGRGVRPWRRRQANTGRHKLWPRARQWGAGGCAVEVGRLLDWSQRERSFWARSRSRA